MNTTERALIVAMAKALGRGTKENIDAVDEAAKKLVDFEAGAPPYAQYPSAKEIQAAADVLLGVAQPAVAKNLAEAVLTQFVRGRS